MAKFTATKIMFYSLEIEAETEAEAWIELRAMNDPPRNYEGCDEFMQAEEEEAYHD